MRDRPKIIPNNRLTTERASVESRHLSMGALRQLGVRQEAPLKYYRCCCGIVSINASWSCYRFSWCHYWRWQTRHFET